MQIIKKRFQFIVLSAVYETALLTAYLSVLIMITSVVFNLKVKMKLHYYFNLHFNDKFLFFPCLS